MIKYAPLWQTLKAKNNSQYQLIKDYGIDKDSDLGKKYIESIQEQAKKTGIKLTPEFEVDEAAYNEMIQSYEAKAKGSQIKHLFKWCFIQG